MHKGWIYSTSAFLTLNQYLLQKLPRVHAYNYKDNPAQSICIVNKFIEASQAEGRQRAEGLHFKIREANYKQNFDNGSGAA